MEKSMSSELNKLVEYLADKVTVEDVKEAICLAEISAAIVKKRIEMGMTQKEFAKFLGVSQGMVSKWEGGYYNYTIKGLVSIAEKLDLELQVKLIDKNSKIVDANEKELNESCIAEETVYNNEKVKL